MQRIFTLRGLYVGILSNKKTFQGTLGTQNHTSTGSRTSLGPLMDLTGPRRWTLLFFRKFRSFLYFIFSSPSYHVGPLVASLSISTKAQGTLLDLHGPQNGSLNEPSEANFWGPLVKKGPAGSHHGPNWSILIDRSPDNGQIWVYRLVWGPTDVWFWSNREFLTEDDNCAPRDY